MVNLPERAFPGANSPVHSKRDEDVPAHAKAYRKAGLGAGPEPLLFVRKDDGFSHAEPPRLAHLTGFGPQVALATCLFGFAWAASSYFSGDQWSLFSSSKPSVSENAASQERRERAELSRAVKKMAGEIRALEARADALRAGQSQAAQTRADLERLTARIDADKSETRAAIAAAPAEAERARREQEAALPQMTGRLDRLERKFAAQEAMPAAAAAAPEVKEKTAPASADPARLESENSAGARKPHLITNWVVRDVYGGVALLESTRGTIEVALGEVVPGAGRVKAIERRGSGWIVITSRGLVDSASDVFMP
jgi:hypothetical protein